jgi:hypothetical protein
MNLYGICSGQNRKPGAPQWGICLANALYHHCPWFRAESADGRRVLTYRTPEQAERARLRMEASPMPARLMEALERARTARARNPAAIRPVPLGTAVWSTTCQGCFADGKARLRSELAT